MSGPKLQKVANYMNEANWHKKQHRDRKYCQQALKRSTINELWGRTCSFVEFRGRTGKSGTEYGPEQTKNEAKTVKNHQ